MSLVYGADITFSRKDIINFAQPYKGKIEILINAAAEIRMDWWEKRLVINKHTGTFIRDLSVNNCTHSSLDLNVGKVIGQIKSHFQLMKHIFIVSKQLFPVSCSPKITEKPFYDANWEYFETIYPNLRN